MSCYHFCSCENLKLHIKKLLTKLVAIHVYKFNISIYSDYVLLNQKYFGLSLLSLLFITLTVLAWQEQLIITNLTIFGGNSGINKYPQIV
jgi:hypothetical protein